MSKVRSSKLFSIPGILVKGDQSCAVRERQISRWLFRLLKIDVHCIEQ